MIEKAQIIYLKVKKNTFVMQSIKTMLLRVIGIITLFGFTLFLTRNYSPKIIGQYDFIRTYLLVVGTICLLGTEQSILYFAGIIKGKGSTVDLKKLYLKKVTLLLITSLLSLGALFIIGDKLINDFFNDVLIFPILFKATSCLFFFGLTTLNTEVFRALDKIYIAELFRNTLKYLSVIIGAVFLLNIHKEYYLVDTFLVGFVFLAIISLIMIISIFNKKIKNESENEKLRYSHKEIIVKSYPMAISGMAFFLLISFDIMLLKKHFGNEIVAYYSTAIKLMTILAMIIISINITVSTKIAEYYSSNKIVELKEIIKKTSRLIFLFTFPITIFICVFSDFILSVFGKNYNQAQYALIILMFGQAICSMFGSSPIYLNMTGRQKIFQNILLIAVGINFFSNFFLIPIYGMIGAAISFVISLFFWNITVAIIVYRKDKIRIFLS